MKKMKKLASLILAMLMVLSMLPMAAFAADNHEYKIKVNGNDEDKATHYYQAYQIFAGDLKVEANEDKVLSNIIWGSGVSDGDGLLTALKSSEKFVVNEANVFANCTSARQVAEVVATFASSDANNSRMIDDFATVVSGYLSQDYFINGNADATGEDIITVNGAGYYLVKDTDGSLTDAEEGAYTRFLLKVVGDSEVTVKSDVPHGDKQIYIVDENGNINTDDANFGVIGSHVAYEITSQVPNYTGYDYYYFIMNDTLDAGLTFDGEDSVNVAVNNQELNQGTLKKDENGAYVLDNDGNVQVETTGDYYVYTGTAAAPYTFRLAFNDIVSSQYAIGSSIKVTYSATVNGDAITGVEGNANTWQLQYSNNPNESYKPGTSPSVKPGLPLEEDETVFGKTPEEKTLTYLIELDITKYMQEVAPGKELAGAEFTLEGTSSQVSLKNVGYYKESANGTWYLLKDGTYTTDVPTGTEYVEIGVGTAETKTGYIKDSNGNYIVPQIIDGQNNPYDGATLYKLVKGTENEYVDVNTKYELVTENSKDPVSAPVNVSMEETTKGDGKIYFKGLGEGKYTLSETITPDGYNTIEPIEFAIKWVGPTSEVKDGTEQCGWQLICGDKTYDITSKEGQFTFGTAQSATDDANNGAFATNIINMSGSLLPSTGGIGTTIFYIVGGVLIVGAGILLVAKKRMSAK